MNTSLLLHADTRAMLDSFCAKPAHAVLLVGHEGTGKALLARELAAELLQSSVSALENNARLRHIAPVEGKILIAPRTRAAAIHEQDYSRRTYNFARSYDNRCGYYE